MNREAALMELIDRAAIHDVLRRYARGVDGRDFDLVASCFTSDCDYRGALAQTTIKDALATLRSSLERYDSTLHFMGNQLIEIDGDAAKSETYCIAYHALKANGDAGSERRSLVVAVRYLDDLARREERWLIERRHAVLVWQRYDALVLPPARAGG
jgi:3-phenylpropionate/cinnamic acid dioxygenase small subunit